MAGQIPVSALSRALRSRVIRPRLAFGSAQCLQSRTPSQIRRPFSSKPTAEESTPLEIDREHETSPPSQPTRSPGDGENADKEESEDRVQGRNSKPKSEEQILMDIASALVTHGATFSSKSIALELKWVVDPKDLADRVGRLLLTDNVAQAAAMTREAQRRQLKCDQAWNHLMRYAMDKGYPDVAFKFYNDMKKRGRMPNARTYTIMLQGFSRAPPSRAIVKKAEAVYRSIFSKQSDVKPNIIHSNAMLGVCQRHGDMDTLWRIAGEMPDEGSETPDMRTYSIILAALQHAARNDIQKMDASQIDQIIARQEKMVIEGKRIWADIVYQWTNDGLELNNQVVNAMAYLLLDGVHDSDFYDVLALYNQTMGVPILAKQPPANPSAARRRAAFKLTTGYRDQTQVRKMDESTKPASSAEDVPFVDEHNRPIQPEPENKERESETSMEEVDMEEEENFESLFEPIATETQDPPLKPDNKDLTMLLNACFNMTQASGQGQDYWNLLTKDTSRLLIKPDEISAMEYIRLLRQTRSSKVALKVIREQLLPAGMASGKLFHVAFATCRRDRRNNAVLIYANELFDMMRKAMVLPDPRVLQGYLSLIQTLSEDPQSLLHMRGLEMEKRSKSQTLQALGKELQAKLRLSALATLRPHVNQLHEAMGHGKPAPRTRWNALKSGNGSISGGDCVKVMSTIRLLIDETLKPEYKQFIPKDERKTLMAESSMLKMYSGKDILKEFRGKLIFPTTVQRNAFREQQQEIMEQAWQSSRKEMLSRPEKLSQKHEAESQPEIETKPEVEAKPKVEAKSEAETKAEVETKA